MERLVTRIGNEPAVPTEIDMDFVFGLDKRTFDGLQRIFNQLCDITDILGDDYDLDRLRELVKADLDGRCVVLWCSPGDRIYSESCIKGEVNEFFAPNDIEWILEHAEDYGKTIFKDYDLCKASLERLEIENLSPEAKKLYHDILTGEGLKGDRHG